MKENEEKKDGKPIEGEDVSKTGMDFGQTDGNGGSHTAVDGGEKDKPVIEGGSIYILLSRNDRNGNRSHRLYRFNKMPC